MDGAGPGAKVAVRIPRADEREVMLDDELRAAEPAPAEVPPSSCSIRPSSVSLAASAIHSGESRGSSSVTSVTASPVALRHTVGGMRTPVN